MEICIQKVNELSRYGMVWTDEYGFLLKPLEPGQLMTKYYLKFDTMKDIIQTAGSSSLEDVLRTVCRSEEIAWIQLRRNEKKLLNEINTDKDNRLRFHVLSENGKKKKRIQTREEKIFVLANDCLTGDPSIHDLSLNQDINSVCSNGCRIARCMKEYFLYKKCYRGALHSTLLAKSLHQRLWDDSPYLLKQLPGIGMVTAKALHSAGINSFKAMEEADPRRIEIITGRKYPFGNHIKESLSSLPPKVEMKIEEEECQRQGKLKLVTMLTRLSQPVSSVKRHYADMIIAMEEDNMILFHEKISRVEEFSSPYSASLLVPNLQGNLTVKAHLIFEDCVGLDINEQLLITRKANPNRRKGVSVWKTPPPPPPPPPPLVLLLKSLKFQLYPKGQCLPCKQQKLDPPASKAEERPSGAVTQQTVFDHIRKKARNFPVLLKSPRLSSSPGEALPPPRKPSGETGTNSQEDQDRGTLILPGPESVTIHSDFGVSKVSSREMHRLDFSVDENPALEPKILRSFNHGKARLPAGVKRPFTDISNVQACVSKELNAAGRREAGKQCGSLEAPAEEAGPPFLGFKSIFSFL
ncbi:hypothetical protein ACLOJK_032568 [Asimina triloba]